MGETDLQPYFTLIIGHNSMNVHRIPTTRGTEIRLNEPFKCAKVHPDWSMHSCFMADFASVRKEVEEKKPKLWPLVSRKWLERFSSNLECGHPTWLALPCSKFGFNRIRDHGARKV